VPAGKGKKVLVTGGTGFIGSHLVERLLTHGYSVTCLVRDQSNLRWLKGLPVTLVSGDCLQSAFPASLLHDISIVFHLAGITKAAAVHDYYRANQEGTKNILQACADSGARLEKFIFVSSLAAAGPGEERKAITIHDPPHPISDYGKSKLLAEQETLRYRDVFPVLIFRPSVVYGPRDMDVYELFRWAVRGIMPEISGGDRYLNFCYVDDLVNALLSGAERSTSSGRVYFVAEQKTYTWADFRTILLQTGNVRAIPVRIPYSLGYIIGLISELAGRVTSQPALLNRQKIREAAQRSWVCDSSPLEKELGFRTHYSLPHGLELTWKWYREHDWLPKETHSILD